MLCHVPTRARLPTIFWQDAYFITFMLLFAVSNGYLVSLTMCLAPRSGERRAGCCAGEPLALRTITPRLLSSALVSSYRTGLRCGTCPRLGSGDVTCLGGPAIFSRGGRAGTLRQVSMARRTNRDILLRIKVMEYLRRPREIRYSFSAPSFYRGGNGSPEKDQVVVTQVGSDPD